LHREYRPVQAVDHISFQLDQGELMGYIGPNGAGKSSTVKILSGILVPDSGRCEIEGRVSWKERIANAARIGVVFGQRTQLWWDLAVIESFDFFERYIPGSGNRLYPHKSGVGHPAGPGTPAGCSRPSTQSRSTNAL